MIIQQPRLEKEEVTTVIPTQTPIAPNNLTTPFDPSKKKIFKKYCSFCRNGVIQIHYRDECLKYYIRRNNKILKHSNSGNCQKHQRQVSNAIKRARLLAFFPFTK